MNKNQLSEYELSLLPKALAYAQTQELTRDGLKRELGCGSDIATRLQHHIQENAMVKVAEHLQALPENAENRAEVQFALGDTSGTSYSYVLRENVRLQKALAKAKHKDGAEKEQRETEIRAEIAAMQAEAKIERKFPKVKPAKKTNLMLELNLSDAHWGKLAWPIETGGEPYDLAVAETMFLRALEVLLERAKGYEFESVLFVLGNDFLHSNDVLGQTAHGTVLDTEGRFQKTYWTARKTMCAVIERLREIAPTKVAVIYGNHDKNSVWTLADSLSCYFHGDDRVEIDNQPIYRKYYQWGKCGLMFTHGDLGKRQDFPLLFATEKPELFASTIHREIHTGHLHTTKTEEFHGVRVRILPSLSPQDAWHSENSFVGNMRNAEAYVWDKEQGLIAQFIYSDNAYPKIKSERKIV